MVLDKIRFCKCQTHNNDIFQLDTSETMLTISVISIFNVSGGVCWETSAVIVLETSIRAWAATLPQNT